MPGVPPVPPVPPPVPAATLYDALAPVYDRWQSAGGMTPFALVALARLIPTLARHGRHRPDRPPPSFVDLGCGTGLLLLGLARAQPDWHLMGVDGSPGMLDCARGKPGGERITWQISPLTAPWLPPPGFDPAGFDAAGCFYDTVNHLADLAALAATVGNVAAALRPGGLFIFDATNALGFQLWWRGKRTWSGHGWSVVVETRFDPARSLGQAEVAIDHEGLVTTAHLTEHCFSETELRAALASAGLDVVAEEPWSPFDIDAPGKTWWITRKKTP